MDIPVPSADSASGLHVLSSTMRSWQSILFFTCIENNLHDTPAKGMLCLDIVATSGQSPIDGAIPSKRKPQRSQFLACDQQSTGEWPHRMRHSWVSEWSEDSIVCVQ